MIYIQPSIYPGKWDAQTPQGFWDTNGSLNLGQTTGPYNNQQQQKKRTCKILAFAVPANHRVKLKKVKKKG